MDRLNQLRAEAGGSRDSTLDTSSAPSEAFMSANESSSKYYSLSEVDSTFDISSIKDDISSIKEDVIANTTEADTSTNPEELISNLSPIVKKSDILDSFKIDAQIEAANILSGGVAIFDDNSYDGNELIIDDNVEVNEKSNSELKQTEDLQYKQDESITEPNLMSEGADIASKDTEVVLQIDGKNVDAIDIGNGLYLYRKEGQEELAAVQIIDDDHQQPSFKFLKVRENEEGNLEVYEEIEIEVPKEVPAKEGKVVDRSTLSHMPIRDINKAISESTSTKFADMPIKPPKKEPAINIVVETESKETSPESKTEVNLNGKMVKPSESRKSHSFTPMAYHSTPKKEGIPLTKTMVDQQLHPNRHSDITNIKKTIEVHTDGSKKAVDSVAKCIDINVNDINRIIVAEKDTDSIDTNIIVDEKIAIKCDKKENSDVISNVAIIEKYELYEKGVGEEMTKDKPVQSEEIFMEQDNVIDSTGNEIINKKAEENTQLREDENVEENRKLIDNNVPVNDRVQELIKNDAKTLSSIAASESDDSAQLMEINNKAELIIAVTEHSVHEKKVKIQDNIQTEQENLKKSKEVESEEIDDSEAILIDDDDVSVVEVIVDSKNEKENEDSKVEVIDNNNPKICNTITVSEKHYKNAQEMTKNIHTDSTTPKFANEIEHKNKAVAALMPEIKTNILTSTEIKKPTEKILPLPNQNKTTNITMSSPLEIENKNIEVQEKKDVFVMPSIQDRNQVIISKATDNPQNNKCNVSTGRKITNIKEVVVKHDIPANIAPLLEQKQQSSVISRVITEKSAVPEKSDVKKLSKSIYDTTSKIKIVEQNMESKVIDTLPRNVRVKEMQATRSTPVDAHMQVHGVNVPTSPALVSTKNCALNIVLSGAELKNKGVPPPKKHVTVEKPQPAVDIKSSFTTQRNDNKDSKVSVKSNACDKATCVMNIEISKVPKLDSVKTNTTTKQCDVSIASNITNKSVKHIIEPKDKKDVSKMTDTQPTNNNNEGVPFGQWTDVNRQQFLDKIKIKPSVTQSNSNQLKNSNDLNRRDVLKKIDSQRQTSTALSKSQEASKHCMKSDTVAFSNKSHIMTKESAQDSKTSQNTGMSENKVIMIPITEAKSPKSQNEPLTVAVTSLTKKEICQTKGNVQNLIDKTIEGMINRNTPAPKPHNEHKNNTTKASPAKPAEPQNVFQPIQQPPCDAKLDEIEMKMNELHGIPFIERPAHQLPKLHKPESKSYSNATEKDQPAAVQAKNKIPNLLPFSNKNQQKLSKDSNVEVDSEDEVIEHEPITGDTDFTKKNLQVKPPAKEMLPNRQEKSALEVPKKGTVITEKDFDKFARRNSITYENCLTVKFDGKESHNVVQKVIEKEINPNNYSRDDTKSIDPKTKLINRHQNMAQNSPAAKENPSKLEPATDDASNKNQSKFQKAYCSALTEKRQMSSDFSVTVIEDKPVKVLFVHNVENTLNSTQLNVQGQDLSPVRNPITESDVTVSTCDSLDSEMLDSTEDVKTKTKHQRKQVLTPVEEPELELIEPRDLGIEVSPKKKRRTDDDKIDKTLKYPIRKKYMLGSSTQGKITNSIIKNPLKETIAFIDNGMVHKSPVSALDSLVKAAELIETQTENMNTATVSNPDSQSNTPVKRGRGRPRKYPLTPDGTVDKSKVNVPSPQKKPRLIDDATPKRYVATDDSDSDEEIIKENWTMGKINENIVCPICKKLFRTENVVFKHVKHCTGPSPNRSDSDKRSPRETRISRDSDSKSQESKSDDMDIDDDKPLITQKISPKIPKSNESRHKSFDKGDVIIIEDTPIKEKLDKIEERKVHASRKTKTKIPLKNDNLVCEFCGKLFRQRSYLISHKLQHKKAETAETAEPKKTEKHEPIASVSVFSCEVCKKEFRKLHHLVQHRIIHNPSSVPVRASRKCSSEQSEGKRDKEPSTSKPSDDPSAGFRCEPCDKSFRKLHHLVEHRETHDGKNRQKTGTTLINKEDKTVEKPIILHECDVCKKTFRKLVLLNEHKEQHVETSSEKSDDKSVKSSLSTKDIIHECSLCYMVFPNEHSLNKHTVNCQRKKRQSKQIKTAAETDGVEEVIENPTPEEKMHFLHVDSPKAEVNENEQGQEILGNVENVEQPIDEPAKTEIPDTSDSSSVLSKDKPEELVNIEEKESQQTVEVKLSEQQISPVKRDYLATEPSKKETLPEVPVKIKKVVHKGPAMIQDTPKKIAKLKEKLVSVTKRVKNTPISTSVVQRIKPAVESSDDDEVRYMLNPNFKAEDVTDEKIFLKVRAKKRNSLQIERPDSKGLMKRRTSLQHPPKIPRLKQKYVESKPKSVPKSVETNTVVKREVNIPKLVPAPSTDSDDSDTTKYSFPITVNEKSTKPVENRAVRESERNTPKKSLLDKRKTLTGIAKRKSLGKAVTAKHKLTPLKQVKKRTLEAEHRCDCGQLFSSAALLSRHTSLAHTPPRIRRRRSPSPDTKPMVKDKPAIKSAPRKSLAVEKPKQIPASRKSNSRSVSAASNTKAAKIDAKPSKESLEKFAKSPSEVTKGNSEKIENTLSVQPRKSTETVKPRRSIAQSSVPVPEKMKKLTEKFAKLPSEVTKGNSEKIEKTLSVKPRKSTETVKPRRSIARSGVPVPEKMKKLKEKKK